MKLAQQVITLEQARKLKELGIVQESMVYHYCYTNANVPANMQGWRLGFKLGGKYYQSFEHYSAFTVAELGVMLPKSIHGEGVLMSVRTYGSDAEWQCMYHSFAMGASNRHTFSVYRISEAEARAAILIEVLEQYPALLEEINNRLKEA